MYSELLTFYQCNSQVYHKEEKISEKINNFKISYIILYTTSITGVNQKKKNSCLVLKLELFQINVVKSLASYLPRISSKYYLNLFYNVLKSNFNLFQIS